METIETKMARYEKQKRAARIAKISILVSYVAAAIAVVVAIILGLELGPLLVAAGSGGFLGLVALVVIQWWQNKCHTEYVNWWHSEFDRRSQAYLDHLGTAQKNLESQRDLQEAARYLEAFRPPWGQA